MKRELFFRACIYCVRENEIELESVRQLQRDWLEKEREKGIDQINKWKQAEVCPGSKGASGQSLDPGKTINIEYWLFKSKRASKNWILTKHIIFPIPYLTLDNKNKKAEVK